MPDMRTVLERSVMLEENVVFPAGARHRSDRPEPIHPIRFSSTALPLVATS